MTKTPIGYPEGGKKYKEEPGKVGNDPRSEIITNADSVPSKIDKGNKVTVQGTGKARKQTATWY
tara:strand:+ start:707 stop:898 length:192 start_codon:yes stop_codon:yes gene_type:complete